ncbi:amidohydrolase family protein [Flavisphingomonas formosensis]|uniref:amidohydrolase family protein n=1 Tax=Flavisphingomonas formosensis TaxID=861534 RepID=UPI0012F8EBFA|nr:amidohydrolase family protein [Sphingomonas formosensis]
MLIRGAEIDGACCDVRITDGCIAAIAPELPPRLDERVLDAAGAALLPGLTDHHIHLNATAAALQSVRCGPPEILDEAALVAALETAPGDGWLRGIGYHPSIGVDVDRAWLDRHGPARPIRIQHRSGRMWILNSRAEEMIGTALPADGRLLDRDDWLRERMGSAGVDLVPLGAQLAGFGITGLTEVTPRNGLADYRRYAEAGLPQRLLIMGRAELDDAAPLGLARRGAVKLHYHDHDLPALDRLAAEVARAHDAGRPVAAHCVTEAELMLTLAAIEAAGPHRGDRIEHAAITTPPCVEWIAALGLTVVTQPHFIVERGAAYSTDVEPELRAWLYRLRGFVDAGIRLAAGSDAPFGGIDPWRAMAAAVDRPAAFGADERLSPEQALALFTGQAEDPGGMARRVAVGEAADLCLIDRPWREARGALAAVRVRATLVGGRIVHGGDALGAPL